MSSDLLLAFDLSGMVWRAWSGGPNAARVVLEWVARLLRAHQPRYAAAAVDRPFPTFRHDLARAEGLPAYKRGRLEGNERASVLEQMRLCEELCEDLLGLRSLWVEGFEADDAIATLITLAEWDGVDALVVARDKDFCQLVTHGPPSVELLDWTNGKRTGPAEVRAKWGVDPERFADFQALVGDAGDGFGGCPGVGPKAAVKLLEHFGTLAQALTCVEGGWADPGSLWGQGLPASFGKKLEKGAALTRTSHRMAVLRRDVPLLPAGAAMGLGWLPRWQVPEEIT